MKKDDDIKLWAEIYKDTFALNESIDVSDADIKDHVTLSLETPGGYTDITFDGEAGTNLWIVDIIKSVIQKNHDRSMIHFYVKKQ